MEKDTEYCDEVRVDIDLPAGLRRQLARESVKADVDLQTHILQIIESTVTVGDVGA